MNIYTFAIECDENMNQGPGSGHRLFRHPNLVKIMPSSDARHVLLVGKDMISNPTQCFRQGRPHGLQSLPCLTGYLDRDFNLLSLNGQMKRCVIPTTPLNSPSTKALSN